MTSLVSFDDEMLFMIVLVVTDLLFFDERIEKGLIDRLRNVIAAPFARITYTGNIFGSLLHSLPSSSSCSSSSSS